MIRTRRPRDERGAVAILMALLIVVLVTMGAFAIDLGNAISRKTAVQGQADLAALAGAQTLNESARAGVSPPATVLATVATYFNNNQPQDDDRACWRTRSCVSASHLDDNDLTNGEVDFTNDADKCGSTAGCMWVRAPNAWVDFGMAGIVGVDGGDVAADAAVQIKSPGVRVMPMFAVSGCDYGRQTLLDPTSSTSPITVPPLAADTDDNETELTAGSLVIRDPSGTVVESIPHNLAGLSGYTVTFSGTRWRSTTKIGLFRGGSPAPSPVEQDYFWLDSDATKTDLSPGTSGFTVSGASSRTISFTVPAIVSQTADIWYVRVYDTAGTPANQWSARSEALPLRVGTSVLECASGPSNGNFGTLLLPRTDVAPADNIVANVAYGAQKELGLQAYTGVTTGICTSPAPPYVESYEPNVLNYGTNCVDTDTGFAVSTATQGFIKGSGSIPPLLSASANPTTCGRPGSLTANRTISFGGGPSNTFTINDDRLSCFLITGKSLADVSSPTYADGAAFEPELLQSPRFFWVPVLKVQPTSGGSQRYVIVDFRAGFITDEVVSASSTKGSDTSTADNGVVTETSGIRQLKVIFFNTDALPRDASGAQIDYLGVGPKVVKLIN